MLNDLGFQKVVGILDGNVADTKTQLEADFPAYKFYSIPADDVRTKPGRGATDPVVGLLDEHGVVRPEHRTQLEELFTEANAYFECS